MATLPAFPFDLWRTKDRLDLSQRRQIRNSACSLLLQAFNGCNQLRQVCKSWATLHHHRNAGCFEYLLTRGASFETALYMQAYTWRAALRQADRQCNELLLAN